MSHESAESTRSTPAVADQATDNTPTDVVAGPQSTAPYAVCDVSALDTDAALIDDDNVAS